MVEWVGGCCGFNFRYDWLVRERETRYLFVFVCVWVCGCDISSSVGIFRVDFMNYVEYSCICILVVVLKIEVKNFEVGARRDEKKRR